MHAFAKPPPDEWRWRIRPAVRDSLVPSYRARSQNRASSARIRSIVATDDAGQGGASCWTSPSARHSSSPWRTSPRDGRARPVHLLPLGRAGRSSLEVDDLDPGWRCWWRSSSRSFRSCICGCIIGRRGAWRRYARWSSLAGCFRSGGMRNDDQARPAESALDAAGGSGRPIDGASCGSERDAREQERNR